MKTVIDMCPFMGLAWIDDLGEEHHKGRGLTTEENERLDNYFARYWGQPFNRDKAIELAQLAIDNQPIPDNFNPSGNNQ